MGSMLTLYLRSIFLFIFLCSIFAFLPRHTLAGCSTFGSSIERCSNSICSYSCGSNGTIANERCVSYGDAEGICSAYGYNYTVEDVNWGCDTQAEAKAICGNGSSDPLAGLGCSITSVDSVQHQTRIDWGVGIESGTTFSSWSNAGTTYGVCGQPVGTGSRPCQPGLIGGNCSGYTIGGTATTRAGTCYLSVTVDTSAGSKTCTKGVAVNCTPSGSSVKIGFPTNNAQRNALNNLTTGAECTASQFPSINYQDHDVSGQELSVPTNVQVICAKVVNTSAQSPHVIDYQGPGTAFHIRDQNAQHDIGYAIRVRNASGNLIAPFNQFPNNAHLIRSYTGGNFTESYCGTADVSPAIFRAAVTCPPTITVTGTVTGAPQNVQICEKLTSNVNPPTNCVNTTGPASNRTYNLTVTPNGIHRLFAENINNYSRSYIPGRNFEVQCSNITGPTITYTPTSTTPTGTFDEASCSPTPLFSGSACDTDNPDSDGDPDTSGPVTVRFYSGGVLGGSTVANQPGTCGGEFNKGFSWNPSGWSAIMDGNPHTIEARAVNAPTGSVPSEVTIGTLTFTNTRSQSTCHFQGSNTCGQQYRTVTYACGTPASSEQITDCPNIACPPVFIRTVGGDVTARGGAITNSSPLTGSPLSINSTGQADAGVVMSSQTVTSSQGFSQLGNSPGVVAQNYANSGNNSIFAPVWIAGILDSVAKNLGYSAYSTANFNGAGAPCATTSGAIVAQRFRVWCTSASRSIDAVLTDIRNTTDPTGVGTFYHIVVPDPAAPSGINQTITAKNFSTVVKNVLVFANNTSPLTISGNITTQTTGTNRSTLLFIVNNGVSIQGNVTQADGGYIFNGTLDSDSTNNSTAALSIRGQVLAMNGGFDLKRVVAGNPGETFTYDPRYLVLFDDLLSRPSYTSRELTPN